MGIKEFLESLRPLPECPISNLKVKVGMALNKRTNVISLTITDLDVLHYIIVPFFSKLQFISRKFIDFKLWIIAIQIRIKGYHFTDKGKSLLLDITKSSNKARYNNNVSLPALEQINEVLKLKPLLAVQSNKSHTKLTKEYTQSIKGHKGFPVYVYKGNVFLFKYNSYYSAQKDLKIKGNKTISRYIDTGKITTEGYSFYSLLKKN